MGKAKSPDLPQRLADERKPRAAARAKKKSKQQTAEVEVIATSEPESALKPLRCPYRDDYPRIAAELVKRGATRADVGVAFGVSHETIRQWMIRHEEFAQAMRAGDEDAAVNVERSLYERAIGYSYEATKVVSMPDGPVQVKYLEHMPPDVSAATKWLHNRSPGRWRPDSAKVELTGANGGPLEVENTLDELELARRVAFLLGKAAMTAEATKARDQAVDVRPVEEMPDQMQRREVVDGKVVGLTMPKKPAPERRPSRMERLRAAMATRSEGDE
jgi:orotate phosphoribosyltransferase-like protein